MTSTLSALSTSDRNPRIDLLRGVSIVAVMLLHFTLAFGIRNSPFVFVLGLDSARALLYNGNYGVTLFFVISKFADALVATSAGYNYRGLRR